MAVLHLSNTSKSFGKKMILNDVSLSIQTGEIVGLFGRNGSGKSTLLKIIFGTLKADIITLEIDKLKINAKDIIKSKKIAYLPQHPFLPKNLRVRDIIPIYYSDSKLQDNIFYDTTIAGFANRKVSELSLGQLKYFEAVLIGSGNHKFVLLDELFSMLEPLQKIELQKFLISKSKTKGILITDHYYDDVLKIATKNIVLLNGDLKPITNEKDLSRFGYLKSIK